MNLKSAIFSLLLLGVVRNCLVEGLQCYVCEDCNEYEDFKELHICGEIPIVNTLKPVTLPSVEDNGAATNKPVIKPTLKPAAKPSSKPTASENPNDYLDSEEIYDEVGAQNTAQKATKKPTTFTQSKTTTKPTTLAAKPTSSAAKPTTSATVKATTQKPTTTEQKITTTPTSIPQETTSQTTTANKTTSSSAAATPTKPKPIDYDDYLEYEDPAERSAKSLLKMNEPVCYMIKYQVNNTVITNRGCTSFINANKYLTCQSLYNGAPMESCRVCSANGCNKFLSGEGDEEDHGIYINAVGVTEKMGAVVLLFWVVINRYVF